MPHFDSVSILLVDDEAGNLLALESALVSLDCRLLTARSGQDALRLVLAQDFAAILLDVRMAGLDGFETASLIRARPKSRSTPILFLTAYDPAGAHVREGYRLGGIDYIYKPFDPHVLRSKVSFFIELFQKTVALERTSADLVLREQQVEALNAELEERVVQRTAALMIAHSELEAEADERVRTQDALRVVERSARTGAEVGTARALVLAEVSRVLVETFMDHRPMLSRVARLASVATDAACVIDLIPEHEDGSGLGPLAVHHPDPAVRVELGRVLEGRHSLADSPWRDLEQVFLERHPLTDSLSVPMLARTSTIGVLSLGRFGAAAAPFTDSDREFADDLTVRIALAVENARLYEKAKTAIELRDAFLTIAAHELKTPLTAIQGYSQLLSHQLRDDLREESERVLRSARMIEDRTKHLARLVEQILDVARLIASRLQLNCEDTDLGAMMQELVADFQSRDPFHEFRLQIRPERLQAVVDPTRLKQVMANLIDNAMRYSPAGGPIEIGVTEEPNASVVLSVRDWGLGIAEEHRAQIFARFHQAHAVEYRSGMGLGLHISREIVLLHGGTITAAFPTDGGSQFTVLLPRTPQN